MVDVLSPAIEVWFTIYQLLPYPIYALISYALGFVVVSAIFKLVLRWSA